VSEAVPSELAALREEIDVALADALDRALPRLEARHPALTPAADALRAFVADGKRIRPALLLLGYRAAGGGDVRDVHGPALALELLHTCALAHDDVIDRAPTRRGRPTIHRRFADEHREQSWAGDPDAFGEAVAILLGDLAFVHADELFLSAHVPPAQLLAGLARFTELREEVMAGQYLDLVAATSRATDRDLALQIATLKSGRYSVARPLEVGALLAGGPDDVVEVLGRFGDPLGRAFQVRDDLLGVFGEEAATGKSVASDLVEGKRTLLVAEAMARLDDGGRAVLEAGLGDPDLTPERAAELRQLLERCGARAAAEDYVDQAVADAVWALDGAPIDPDVAGTLRELAGYLGARAT
jgi:geranylgeranyl diphosphate synthase, type I